MNKILQKIPFEIRYLLKVYFSGIIVFTFFRILLFIIQHQLTGAVSSSLIFQAFIMGFRFDTVVSCYILSLPALLIFTILSANKTSSFLIPFITIYTVIAYSLAFFICCVDIPYFNHYLTRVTVSVLNWTENPVFMLKLVFQDMNNYFFLAVFILLIYLIIKRVKTISKKTLKHSNVADDLSAYRTGNKILITILITAFLFIGIRGRLALKSPIQWGSAFISDNNFINQLGLNPNFTFLKSYISSRDKENDKIHFMDNQLAVKNIQQSFNIPPGSAFNSPIARKINSTGDAVNANVVIVIMESMGLSKMKLDNNPVDMTPYLDSLSKLSCTFSNVFSSGIHTYNGIYSTLFGMPSLMNQHTMFANENTIQPFTGIANTLKQYNYQSVFMCPHDEEFDNMSGFLKANGFDKIIGQKDFSSSEIVSTMGVPDDVLFEHVVNELNNLSKSPHPFLASVLTGSDHEPIYIPTSTGFVPKTKEKKQQVVEYADWSINKFLKLCAKQPWYDNTIFVFVGDHGSWYRDFYEMNLSYQKVPLIIFSPKIISQPMMNNRVGGQIDIFPTIMGILNREYVNNTMGVDLLKEGRKYIAFSADDKLGCVNDQYFWYYNYAATSEYLLHYRDRDPKQYIGEFPQLKDSLKNYAESLFQATQWLLDNKKVGKQ